MIIGYGKMEIIGNFDKSCFGKGVVINIRKLGGEKVKIRIIGDFFKIFVLKVCRELK